ncbi:MAG: glycosyltransferase family 87 protein [Acidimicrobiia bacterium]|nr:glycosyltransferase family 87 protein [Acidimicrobiia bacterium]
MDFDQAAVWWSFLSVAVFAVAWWALSRELGWAWLAWLTPLFAWWFPLELHLRFGQWSILLFALVVAAWIGLRRDRDRLAGLALGAAVLVKLFPALLLLVVLVQRRFRALRWAVSAVVAGVVAAWVWRPTASSTFVTDVVVDNSGRSNLAFGNASVRSFVSKLFEGGPFIEPVVDAPGLVVPLSFLAIGGVLALTGYVLWASSDLDLRFATVVVAMLALSPVTWVHAWVLLLLPLLVLARRPVLRRAPLLAVGLALTVALTQVDHWRLMQRLRGAHEADPLGALGAPRGARVRGAGGPARALRRGGRRVSVGAWSRSPTTLPETPPMTSRWVPGRPGDAGRAVAWGGADHAIEGPARGRQPPPRARLRGPLRDPAAR